MLNDVLTSYDVRHYLKISRQAKVAACLDWHSPIDCAKINETVACLTPALKLDVANLNAGDEEATQELATRIAAWYRPKTINVCGEIPASSPTAAAAILSFSELEEKLITTTGMVAGIFISLLFLLCFLAGYTCFGFRM